MPHVGRHHAACAPPGYLSAELALRPTGYFLKERKVKIRAQIGVVGAGPAGARAAELLADRGADVVLFDPHAPWEKPCGGGLTASAFANIPELTAVRSRSCRIDLIHAEADTTSLMFRLDSPLYILSRIELARWQLDRALAAGALFERCAVCAITRVSNGWELDCGNGDRAVVSLLVGADGATSRVRAVVAPELEIELEQTRVAYIPAAGSAGSVAGLRFFPNVKGYAWDFPRPDHRSVGIGIAARTWSRRRMDQEVNRYCNSIGIHEYVRAQRAGAVIGTAERRLGARYALIGCNNYALLGDAAGFADPATGEGIQNALRSAGFLAAAFERDRHFARYPAIARSTLEPEFTIARCVRVVLYGGKTATRLVQWAATHASIYAFLAAVIDGANTHDPMLLRRIPAEWRRLRGDQRPAFRAGSSGAIGR